MTPANHNAILPMFSPMAKEPPKRYRTIVADPPWAPVMRSPRRFDGHENQKNSYSTMSNEQLMSLPVGAWAQDDSHLYLWAMNSNVAEAYQVARSWGFRVASMITWLKGRIENGRLIHHIGLGQHYRNSTEHVLFCTRGSLPALNRDQPTAFIAPRTGHSEKPATFYDIVEHVSPGPYLDVFARKQRMGWDTFGDEAFNFGTTEPPEAFTGAKA